MFLAARYLKTTMDGTFNLDDLAAKLSRAWQLKQNRRYDKAGALCDQLLLESPDRPEVLLLATLVNRETGKSAIALALALRAINSQPNHPLLYNVAGVILDELRRFSEATAYFEKALDLSPDYHEARCNLGLVFYHQHNYARAAQCFKHILHQCPHHETSLANLGMVFLSQGAALQAVDAYEKALAVNPKQAHWWGNLGAAYAAVNQFSKAVSCLQNALAIDSKNIDHYINLGVIHRALGEWQSSINMFLTALTLDPQCIEVISHLFVAYQSTCQWQALEPLRPILDEHIVLSLRKDRLPCEQPMMLLRRSSNVGLHLEVARSWSRFNAQQSLHLRKPYTHIRGTRRTRRITIGYLSSDFRNHAVGHQLFPLFSLHNRHRFNVLAFSTGHDDGSPYRQSVECNCDEFVELQGLPISLAAERILERSVDILIDLNGFSHGHRIGIPALRPAPVQVGYLGYLSTTGADFIDYLIADRIVLPEHHVPYYTEKIIRMPHCYQMVHNRLEVKNEPAAKRNDWGLPKQAFVFGSFNQAYKISAELFECWCRILKRTPYSVLWLYVDNTLAEKNLLQSAQQHGIAPSRLIFARKVPLPVHLARLPLTDLVLDTDNYNGGATTANALTAGVPVLSLIGGNWVSRMTASHLIAAGLPELIAPDYNIYERIAVTLADSPEKLEVLRQKLNSALMTSPLFNTQAFVVALENAYETIWQRFVNRLPPDHIDVPSSAFHSNHDPLPLATQEWK